MFLKKLYVNGFKSIGKKVEIDLMNDVNVIMGPNGSGKSNFFECIQWVLGGMSAKQLRASSMEDVIFDGGSNLKPADVAEATLIFDNTDRELEVDTDEVAITRRLTRGKGNEYFINYEPAKLKDLTSLFLNKGIGKNNYAITGQNRITEFIMMKPEDIRGVIEEAAGISGFRYKKNELVNSIANYDRDLERIDAVISEIERSLRPLKKQIKNAELYETTKKELDERKLFYYSKKLDDSRLELENLNSKLSMLKEDENTSNSEKIKIEEFMNEYNDSILLMQNTLTELENIKTNIEVELTELGKDKIMKENDLNNLVIKKENMLSNIKNLEEASSVEEEEKNNLFSSINSLSQDIESLKNNIKETDEEIVRLKEVILKAEEIIDASKEDSTNYLVDIEKKEKDKDIIEERLDTLKISLLDKSNSIEKVENEMKSITDTTSNNNSSVEDIKQRLISFKENESKIKAIDNVINMSKKSEGRKRRTNEIKSLLSKVKGFHDVLFNIVSYDEKYINAMDTLYGGVLHNFVVEDVKAAESCVTLLKKNKIPPANFIIISKLKTQSRNMPTVDNVENVAKILSYDKRYENLILDYFGNTFIAKDSKTAEESWNSCNQKYRICTLEGTLYSTNVIRGGYVQKDTKKLKADYDKLLQEKNSLLTFNGELLGNIYELKGKISLLEKENEVLGNQLNRLQKTLDELNSERFRIDSEIKDMGLKLEAINLELGDFNNSKLASENLLIEKQQELSNNKESVEKLTNQREVMIIDINKKETLFAEHEKNYYIYKNNSKEQIEALKENIDIVNDQIELLEEQFSKSNKFYLDKNDELVESTEKWNNQRQKIEDYRAIKDEKSNRLTTLISEIANANNEMTKLNYKLEKVNEEIQVSIDAANDIPEDTDFIVYDEDMKSIYNTILSLQKKIKSLGFINTDAVAEYKELNSRYEVMTNNKSDLESCKIKIMTVLQKMQDDMTIKYMDCYNCLRKDFSEIFTKLFNGGSAELIMENPDIPLETGVVIKATPPGKKNKAISLLSGGEKSLAAVSFIFALLKYSPSPVVIFDEIDAALDEINVSLIADYIKSNGNVQYVIVSHRRPMMQIAKALYGASMNKGVTELISQKL